MSESLKNLSRKNWTVPDGTENYSSIQTSALMRIADATELMAKNYLELQQKAEKYEKLYNEQMKSKYELLGGRDKTISNLRGQITKLKKKISNQNSK